MENFALDPIQRTLLEVLKDHLQVSGVALHRDGKTVAQIGRLSGGGPIHFLEYELFTGLFERELTSNESGAIRTAAQMMTLFTSARKKSDLKAIVLSPKVLIKSLFEIAVQLESRSRILVHYDKILQANEKILLAQGLSDVLQVLMDTAMNALNGQGSSLLLVDPRTGELYFNVVAGDKGGELKEIRIPPGKGIAGSIVKNAKPELIRDVAADPRAFQEVDQKLDQRTRDMVVAPLIARDRVIGVVEVINSGATGGFTKEDLEFLTNIASHTSLLIENAKNRDDLIKTNFALDRKISELNAINEIMRVLNSTLDPIEMRRGLLRSVMKLMKIKSGAILIPDSTGHRVVSELRVGYNEGKFEESNVPVIFDHTGDILVWLKQNREPFYFAHSQGGETEGLVRRLKSDNPTGFADNEAPDLWMPVFQNDNESLSFVVSLGEGAFRRKAPSDDLSFFKGLMSVAYAAVRNVESYQNAVQSREQEERIRRAFQRYVPEKVVEDVLMQDEAPHPRSQRISVLFADIRGFTQLSENREPSELLELLNEFFEEMVGSVSRNGGIVDKFMGDSIMALFGVPEAGATDAQNSLLTARDMFNRLAILNQDRASRGKPEFLIGIGVNSGPAVIGNMGARVRMDYTAIGDTVNIAARLEQLTRLYHVRILITEETLRESASDLICREADLLQARGRSGLTRVYQLAASPEEEQHILKSREVWTEMLKAFRSKNFWDCLQILVSLPGDPLAEVFKARCEVYVKSPPPADWNGVFHIDSALV